MKMGRKNGKVQNNQVAKAALRQLIESNKDVFDKLAKEQGE